jgi:hypothetical protein
MGATQLLAGVLVCSLPSSGSATPDQWVSVADLEPTCDGVERIHIRNLSREIFTRFRGLKPLIIEGHKPVMRARRHFERGVMLAAVGSAAVQVGNAAEIVRAHGQGPEMTTFHNFVEQHMWTGKGAPSPHPLYLFDRGNFFETHEALRRRLPFPSGLLRQRKKGEQPPSLMGFILDGAETGSNEAQGGEPRPDHDVYLLLGGNSSSVGFHAHADSLVALLFGQKRWWLYPPDTVPKPRWRDPAGMSTWRSNATNVQSEALECLQRPGEMLYVPESWHHATLNYGDTLAVAQQSRVGSSQWLRLRLLGTQLGNSRAWTEAKEVLDETLRLYPDRAESHSAMALLLMDVLEQNPPPPFSAEDTAVMWEQAERLLVRAVELDRFDDAVYANLCKIVSARLAPVAAIRSCLVMHSEADGCVADHHRGLCALAGVQICRRLPESAGYPHPGDGAY